ncbi:MAG: ATP-binding cassette domain-containing protein [Spirochaetota bacterium]|nr:MAG: ATP-binding cassette domain-containing protein [Spirochaetota bacterium]
MNNYILELKDVSIFFDEEVLLNSISMTIPRGKLVAVTGPSGCGKSTLLKIAAGLLPPDSGNVFIEGTDIFNISRNTLFTMRKHFAFVFQDGALMSNLTLYNNLALPLKYHYRLKDKEISERVNATLEDFGLEDVRMHLPAKLSIGQRKLASFARALIMEPKLIFFDEPVSGVDSLTLNKMIDKIIPLRDDPEVTVIMVSHNLEFIKTSADYIALIYENNLFAYGKRDDIMRSDDPILQRVLSIIVDEQEIVAEEVLKILTDDSI